MINRRIRGKEAESYVIKDSSLVKYNGTAGNAALIPYGVTEIGEKAFANCRNLITIFLPETVKKIDDQAFLKCENLKFINIPSSVNYIGEFVFDGCKKLRRLYIPDSVKKCHLLGNLDLDHLRMPLNLWNYGIISDTNINHLALGVTEDTVDPSSFNMNIFNTMEKGYPAISFEKSEEVAGVVANYDGCIIAWTDHETSSGDEYWGVVNSIPDFIMAIPAEVEVLARACVSCKRNKALYIPKTVEYIHHDAFESWEKPVLITPESNYQHLISILPDTFTNDKDITIFVI